MLKRFFDRVVGVFKQRKRKSVKAPEFLEATHFPDSEKDKEQRMVVDVSSLSIAKGAAVVLLTMILFYFFYDIGWILLIFFISFLFAAALDPLVDRMQNSYKIPRALGMLIIYMGLFLFMAIFATKVVTLIIAQVDGIAQTVGNFVSNTGEESLSSLPFGDKIQPYIQQFLETVDIEAATAQLQDLFNLLSGQLVSISIGLFNLLIVLVLTFFMATEEKSIEQFFHSIFPSKYGKYISARMSAIKHHIGLWLRGQFLVSLASALLTYIGLVIMGVQYVLTLSIIAGVLMVIPVFGRFFAWIVTFPIVFNQSPDLSLWMTIYYVIISQVESNAIVPYIMKKAVGLSPIVIIFAMMVGGHYLDILGFILAIPIAAAVGIFVRDYTLKKEK